MGGGGMLFPAAWSGAVPLLMLLVGHADAARPTRCESRVREVRAAVLGHVAGAEEGARLLLHREGGGGEAAAVRESLRRMLRGGGRRNLDDVLDQVARMQLSQVAPSCAEDEDGRSRWSALRTELMEAVSSASERVALLCRGALSPLLPPPLLRRVEAAAREALGATACATSSTAG